MIGTLGKDFARSLLRSHWRVQDAAGTELFEAHEASWFVALLRRFADLGPDWFSLLSWLPFNFVLVREGEHSAPTGACSASCATATSSSSVPAWATPTAGSCSPSPSRSTRSRTGSSAFARGRRSACSTARATCTREATPSLTNRLRMCVSIVFSLKNRRPAISRL